MSRLRRKVGQIHAEKYVPGSDAIRELFAAAETNGGILQVPPSLIVARAFSPHPGLSSGRGWPLGKYSKRRGSCDTCVGPNLYSTLSQMQELLEKIESNAAARLVLPPGRLPTQELARYKTFLKVETHRLKILHRAGGGGLQICRGRAAILDVLLRYLWNTAKSNLSPEAQKEFPQLS